MGSVSGNQLKVKTRRVQGGIEPGQEVTDADAWMQDFADHGYASAKQAFDAATEEEKTDILSILQADADVFDKQANLQNLISNLQEDDAKQEMMNDLKSAFPHAF